MRHDSPILWPVWQCKGGNHLSSSRLLRLKLRQLKWSRFFLSRQPRLSGYKYRNKRRNCLRKKVMTFEVNLKKHEKPKSTTMTMTRPSRARGVRCASVDGVSNQWARLTHTTLPANSSTQTTSQRRIVLFCSCISRFDSESPLSRR